MSVKCGGNPYIPAPERSPLSLLVLVIFAAILLLVAIVSSSCGADAPAKDPGSNNPPVLAPPENPGQKIFQTNCAVCHGILGKGDGEVAKAFPKKPQDLTLPEIQNLTDSVLSQKIRNGAPLNGMPAWKNFTDKEMDDLVVYIKTLK